MAEPRRIQLTALSSNGPAFSGAAAARKALPGHGEKETRSGDTGTVRVHIALIEPDERSFQEFNYRQLVDKEISQMEDRLSSLEEEKKENDEIAALARKLEEKYAGKHKKKDRIEDLIDIGYGYDDEDSFIDNSEAYDEFVPSSITTKYGGFYVNSGTLQFRQASDSEAGDLPMEEGTSEPTKKLKENCRMDKPKKQCRANAERNIDVDLKLSTLSATGPDNRIKKKKRAVKTLSVTSMLKKFQREKEKERQRMQKVAVGAPAPHLFPPDAAGGGGLGLTDPLLSLIGSTTDHALIQAASTVDFDLDLDSLLDVSDEPLSPKPQTTEDMRPDDPTPPGVSSDAEAKTVKTESSLQPKLHSGKTQAECAASSPQCAPLPEGLPPWLEENIRKLMMAAKTSEGESKLKFFNPDINSILLDIELQCQGRGSQLRSKVYRHLSSFMPCSKDTLLKRVKKLLVTRLEERPSVETSLQKLKEAIERSMPEQIASFNESCRVYEQVKTLRATEEENMEEKSGRKGGPKKLFRWNPEIRDCLDHILKGKMNTFKEDQEVEEYLKNLLDDIKSLWPKGWMQSRVLLRESKKLLGLTSFPGNKAKFVKGTSSKPSDSFQSLQEAAVLSEVTQGSDRILTEATDVWCPADHKEEDASKKAAVAKIWSICVDSSSPPQSCPVRSISQVTLQGRDVTPEGSGQVVDG